MGKAKELAELGDKLTVTSSTVTVSGFNYDNIIDSAPGTLNTLNELAAALGDDANYATTTTAAIATKLPLAGGTMTGTIAGFTSTGIDDNASSTAFTIDNNNFLIYTTSTQIQSAAQNGYITVAGGNNSNDGGNITMYGPSHANANIIKFRNSTTEAMRIIASGNIGIGTTSPDANLVIEYAGDDPTGATSRVGAFSIKGGHTTLDMGVNDDSPYNSWIQTRHKSTATYPTAYYNLAINPLGGNVGIGTTSPTSKLNISASPTGQATAHILQVGATNNPTLTLEQTGGGGNGNDNQGLLIKVDGQNTGVGNALRIIGTNDNLNSGTDINILAVQNGGNVGIGIASPGSKLHIKAGDNAYTGGIQIEDTDSTTKSAITHVNGGLYISSNATNDHISILANGNVGIGYTSPNEKLHVNGSIEASAGYKLASHPILDYTGFDGGYATRLGSTGTSTLNSTQIYAGGSVQATFKGGNLGIGTSSGVTTPVSRLNVRAANNHTNGSDREDLVTFHQGISAWQVGRGAGIRWVGDVSRTMAGISTYIFGTEQTGLAFETGGATSTGNLDPTTRMLIDHNGHVGIGYAGAALQQANSQAMTITTPASGGGQGIAIKRLDSNSDQQLGAITFSNNTQDGLGGMVMKTDGAVNSTELKFSTTTGGTSTDQLRIRHNGKVQFTQRETLMAGVEIRHAVFGTANYNRRVEVVLDNYESCYVRFMAQRTNGGSCLIYWEGYINNNNNAGYYTPVAQRLSNGTISASFSVSGGYFRWDIAAAGSSGDGTIYLMGCRGGPSINITTF